MCSVAQLCLTLCDPMDSLVSSLSSPGSSVHGIFKTRILEWVTISYLGDLPCPGIKPTSPALADVLFTTASPRKPQECMNFHQYKSD